MRLHVARIRLVGVAERPDPRALRASIERELARTFDTPPVGDRTELSGAVGDAVRNAIAGSAPRGGA